MIADSRVTAGLERRVDFLEARALMREYAAPIGTEWVELSAAYDRILATTLHAQGDLMPFARSAMDGYALRASDTRDAASAALVLPIDGALFAGDLPTVLAPRTAMAIATGAPLPDGADAVIPFERIDRRGETIVLREVLEPGDHVFPPGDDAKRGDVLTQPGDLVTPGRAALLAGAGHARVCVYRRPRVAIVSSGNEVVDIGALPRPGQVRNSNSTMLAAHAVRDGFELVSVMHATDDRASVAATLRDALAQSDVVITTGGASRGDRDLMKETLVSLGAEFAFGSIALRPAKPTGFARCGNALVAVLPGNPAAAFTAYAALVRGLLRQLAGRSDPFPASISATLQGSIHAKADRHFLMFGHLHNVNGDFHVAPLANQCSSLVRTSADANGLIVVPPGTRRMTDGDRVAVEVSDWNAVPFAGSAGC